MKRKKAREKKTTNIDGREIDCVLIRVKSWAKKKRKKKEERRHE